MSRRLNLNVKNVILGCNNFSDILARNDYRILTGIAPSSGPRAIAPNKLNCNFYKQNYVKTSTFNHVETAFPRKLDQTFLKRASSEVSVTGKWLEEVQTGPTRAPVCGLPSKSLGIFRDDRKNPHYPLLIAKSQSASEMASTCLSPLCPPCPLKPDKFNPKSTLCGFNTVILNNCRFYCANPCQPKGPEKRSGGPCKPNPCGPKKAMHKPEPKCRKHKKPKAKSGGGSKRCKPKFTVGKSCGGSSSGGDPCAGMKKPKKHCYGSGSKHSGSKKGPIPCPPPPKCK